MKVIAVNKSASFEYFIEEKFEAGIVLEGSEVKSLRAGKASLGESFCELSRGEVLLKNMHIALYDKSGAFSTRDSRKDRKLLLHKQEIAKIAGKVNEKGYTLVPLKLYFKWGIEFEEPYILEDKGARKVTYMSKDGLMREVEMKYPQKKKILPVEFDIEYDEELPKRRKPLKTGGV